MPERFLLQILRTLVTHGLLTSVRGVYGGYCLARSPEEISLLEIIEAIDGPFALRLPDATPSDAALEQSLHDLSERLRGNFAEVKLVHLVSPPCEAGGTESRPSSREEGARSEERKEMAASQWP
jgi:Rrf2 family protein